MKTERLSGDEQHVANFPKLRPLYEKAKALLPREVIHDGRYMLPLPIQISHASVSHEWDVDGYEYVDYVAGHGVLVLGPSHASLIRQQGVRLNEGHIMEQWMSNRLSGPN